MCSTGAKASRGFLKLMQEVRQTPFDYAFDMQGLLRTGLMIWRDTGTPEDRAQ